MDRVKKARTPVRARVTRLHNQIKAEIATGVPFKTTLEVLLERLEAAQARLVELDHLMIQAMLDAGAAEADLEIEDDESEDYQDGVRNAKRLVREAINPNTDSAANSSSTTVGGHSQDKRTFKLPKVELKHFNGELREWLGWWAQFKKIHEDRTLHATDKFQYLVQSITGGTKASDLVSSYPMSEENYPKVITALQERFGKRELLQEVYVRELLGMVTKNAANPKTTVSLSSMYDKLEAQLRALSSLGINGTNMSVFLHPMIESSLPENILLAWQRSSNYGRDGSLETPPKSKYDYLMEFIRLEVENEAKRTLVSSFDQQQPAVRGKQNTGGNKRNDIPTASSLYVVRNDDDCCLFCEKPGHRSEDCFKARSMSMEERQKKIKEYGCCFICLKKGHGSKGCKQLVKCFICDRRHLTIMCREQKKNDHRSNDSQRQPKAEPVKKEDDEGIPDPPPVNPSTSSSNQVKKRNVVLLKTLRVRVRGTNGKEEEVRLLLDDGSQQSYIATSLAKRLNCKEVEKLTIQNTLFGGATTKPRLKSIFNVIIRGSQCDERIQLKLMNEDVLCGSSPIVPSGPWLKELEDRHIFLTDTWADTSQIQILIGSDLWGLLMTGRTHKTSDGLFAMETVLGWTLSGELPITQHVSCNYANTVISLSVCDDSLSKMWRLETIGIHDDATKISQEEHDQHVKISVKENIVREPDGRYSVKLPWIDKSTFPPANRAICEKRLHSTTERLVTKNELENYGQIFIDWEGEGIIEKSKSTAKEHFLPHHPVFKPESITTPVRPVFDASCRSGNFPSLNQCLEKGPNLLEEIPSILLRFRMKNVAAVADIRKAFQMIGVDEEDRHFQKFLWWEDLKTRKKIIEFQHARVVFGMNCSPFILAAVIEHHLDHVRVEDQPVAEVLQQSLYVDNCVASFQDEEEFMAFKYKSTSILSEAKMELRQWESNVDRIMEQKITSVLGIKWDKREDELYCSMPKKWTPDRIPKITKRTVLSLVAQIFDPLGFLCPALLQPKLLLQASWIVNRGLDEEWSQEESKKFLHWTKGLQLINNVRVPRNAFGSFPERVVSLHMFSDASQHAYAAVVFVRVEDDNCVAVQMLAAKSRLAPVGKSAKKVTIPRLELLACLIGSRLLNTVVKALSLSHIPIYLWSDSSVALAWISRDEDWVTFVGNRVREIRKLTCGILWRHVPGSLNPFDLPSRGCSIQDLVTSKWWEGPDWLKESEETWPVTQVEEVDKDAVFSEKKKSSHMNAAIVVKMPRFSSYRKNVNVKGWVRRFVANCKKKINGEIPNMKIYLSLEELRMGERDLIMEIQQQHFSTHPKLPGLCIIQCEDGLYHVKTRLLQRDDSEQFKLPVLLPKENPYVLQLIEYVHRSNCHGGTQSVLGSIREKYWIVQGRRTVQRVIRSCDVLQTRSGRKVMKPARYGTWNN